MSLTCQAFTAGRLLSRMRVGSLCKVPRQLSTVGDSLATSTPGHLTPIRAANSVLDLALFLFAGGAITRVGDVYCCVTSEGASLRWCLPTNARGAVACVVTGLSQHRGG